VNFWCRGRAGVDASSTNQQSTTDRTDQTTRWEGPAGTHKVLGDVQEVAGAGAGAAGPGCRAVPAETDSSVGNEFSEGQSTTSLAMKAKCQRGGPGPKGKVAEREIREGWMAGGHMGNPQETAAEAIADCEAQRARSSNKRARSWQGRAGQGRAGQGRAR
jgi:hypothetical protein